MVKETLDSGGESITPPDAETSGLPGAGARNQGEVSERSFLCRLLARSLRG